MASFTAGSSFQPIFSKLFFLWNFIMFLQYCLEDGLLPFRWLFHIFNSSFSILQIMWKNWSNIKDSGSYYRWLWENSYWFPSQIESWASCKDMSEASSIFSSHVSCARKYIHAYIDIAMQHICNNVGLWKYELVKTQKRISIHNFIYSTSSNKSIKIDPNLQAINLQSSRS